MLLNKDESGTYGLDCRRNVGKYPYVPRRSSGPREPRFPKFGNWVAGIRKAVGLEQQELAELAGISIDQVSRLERGANVGIWYVASILSALDEKYGIVADEHALMTGLLSDGAAIRWTKVLSERLVDNKSERPRKNR
jgi:transcriptional regulator with XRE-family HTH domain